MIDAPLPVPVTNCSFRPQAKVSPAREQKRAVLVQEPTRQMQALEDVAVRLAVAAVRAESLPRHTRPRDEPIPQRLGPRIIFNEQFQSILSEEEVHGHVLNLPGCLTANDTSFRLID